MIINKQGVTPRTHKAMGEWLQETQGLFLKGSSIYWIEVDRIPTDSELEAILSFDVTSLEEDVIPKTQGQLLSELQLQVEMQEELLSILLGE